LKRYLFTTPMVIFLVLMLPMLSNVKLSEDVTSYSVAKVDSYNHIVNGLAKLQPVHMDKIKSYLTQQFVSIQSIVSSSNTLINVADQDLAAHMFKIIIDAGHGGRDPGSPGSSEKEEKLYTLSLAYKVFDLLQNERDITPILTRRDDSYMTTEERVTMANHVQVDLFISLHANSFTNKKTRGTETYYYNRNSISLANILHKQLIQATGFPDRKVRQMDYKVIKETSMPSALLEIGYLSNPAEESIMIAEVMQNKVAASIVRGIKQYMNTEL
jgi:N-acetylmuramoyl-L-alanine amidase